MHKMFSLHYILNIKNSAKGVDDDSWYTTWDEESRTKIQFADYASAAPWNSRSRGATWKIITHLAIATPPPPPILPHATL